MTTPGAEFNRAVSSPIDGTGCQEGRQFVDNLALADVTDDSDTAELESRAMATRSNGWGAVIVGSSGTPSSPPRRVPLASVRHASRWSQSGSNGGRLWGWSAWRRC